MLRSFLCELWRPLDSGAALRDVGNADGQMAANRDLAKKRFDRADLRNAGVGKSAKIILYGGKILGDVGISHGENGGFLRRAIQNRLQERATGIAEGNRVGQTVRAFHRLTRGGHHVDRRNHGLRLVHRFHDLFRHGRRDARIHVNRHWHRAREP